MRARSNSINNNENQNENDKSNNEIDGTLGCTTTPTSPDAWTTPISEHSVAASPSPEKFDMERTLWELSALSISMSSCWGSCRESSDEYDQTHGDYVYDTREDYVYDTSETDKTDVHALSPIKKQDLSDSPSGDEL